MPKRPKHKMSQADRAKQFMPFAALKGFEEALQRKEEQIFDMYEGQYTGHEGSSEEEPGEESKAEEYFSW